MSINSYAAHVTPEACEAVKQKLEGGMVVVWFPRDGGEDEYPIDYTIHMVHGGRLYLFDSFQDKWTELADPVAQAWLHKDVAAREGSGDYVWFSSYKGALEYTRASR